MRKCINPIPSLDAQDISSKYYILFDFKDYVSKEDALKDHIASLGEDPQDFLGYNPLKASLEVKLKANYANTDSVAVIESKLGAFEYIDRIAYQKDMVSLVNENVRKVSLVLLGLAVVLLIVSIALINNTVRLSVYSNRFLINTMKLVGATHSFIRKPYIVKGMLNGLIAALIALVLLTGLRAVACIPNSYNI
jgi:cell division transport system permease protein